MGDAQLDGDLLQFAAVGGQDVWGEGGDVQAGEGDAGAEEDQGELPSGWQVAAQLVEEGAQVGLANAHGREAADGQANDQVGVGVEDVAPQQQEGPSLAEGVVVGDVGGAGEGDGRDGEGDGERPTGGGLSGPQFAEETAVVQP